MSCNYAEGLSPYPDKGQVGMPERFAGKEEVSRKVAELAALMKASRHTVFHTGAGISTSAGIPDFRGPKGVWTLEKKGLKPEVNVSFDDARPTYTHMALVALEKAGLIQYLVTQNIDGLHLRSGFPRRKMAELHGNMYLDKCSVCKREFVRCTAVSTVGQKSLGVGCPGKRDTGRRCRGRLHDNILDWEHDLPHLDYNLAEKHSVGSDLSVCLGTTLQIIPSGVLPTLAKQSGGKLVICNLQPTKHDKISDIIINGYVDDVMRELLSLLNIVCSEYSMEQDPVLITRALKTKLASSSDAELIEWTIPDSWFDDKDLIEKVGRNKAIADKKNAGKKYPKATKIDRRKRKSPIKPEVKKEETGESSSQDEGLSARDERYKKRSLDAGQLETNKRKRRTSDNGGGAINSSLESDFNVDGIDQTQKSSRDSDFSMESICDHEKTENKTISTGGNFPSLETSPTIKNVCSDKDAVQPLTDELGLVSTKKEENVPEECRKADYEMLPLPDLKENESVAMDGLSQGGALLSHVRECGTKNSDQDSETRSSFGKPSFSETCSVESGEKVDLNEVSSERTSPSETSPSLPSCRTIANETVEGKISFSKSIEHLTNESIQISNAQTSPAESSISLNDSSRVIPMTAKVPSAMNADAAVGSCPVNEPPALSPVHTVANDHEVASPVTSISNSVPLENFTVKSEHDSPENLNSSSLAERRNLKSQDPMSCDRPSAPLMLDRNKDHSEMCQVSANIKSCLKSLPEYHSSSQSSVHNNSGSPKGDANSNLQFEDSEKKSSTNLSSLLPVHQAAEHDKISIVQFECLSSQKTSSACENLEDSALNIAASSKCLNRNSSKANSVIESQSTTSANANGSSLATGTHVSSDSANENFSGSNQVDSNVAATSCSETSSSMPSTSEKPCLFGGAQTK